MGQQQLLLITLGAIVVGIAVVAGINLFTRSAAEINRDQIINDLMYLATDAQAYYKKGSQFGGGDGSYEGWDIPDFYKRYAGGRIRVNVNTRRDRVRLVGIGTEIGNNGRSKVKVRAIVRPTSINISILN